jgi:methylated-DNA-[protein]-cysteine S-methyltransferase
MDQIYFTHMKSPVGRLLLVASDRGLKGIGFPEGKMARQPERGWKADPDRFAEVIRQLTAYFSGELREFDLELAPEGTPFQLRVWRQLASIPYGTTVSYGEIARRIGSAKAVRAVGAANGRNPLPIVVPCHRVIGGDGSLTGYGGGLSVKEELLALERKHVVKS